LVYRTFNYTQGGPQTEATVAQIFKTTEPICIIFGTLQRRFLPNISDNSILIKFTTLHKVVQ